MENDMESYYVKLLCEQIESILNISDFNRNEITSYTPRQTIYHYTSPMAFKNIIVEREIWLSRADCLNDYSEGEYIRKVFNRALNTLYDDDQFSIKHEQEYKFIRNFNTERIFEIVKSLQTFQKTPTHSVSDTYETYICCFSKKRDSLPMWNYYIKGNNYEGFNIGFNGWYSKDNNPMRNCSPVIYNYGQQIKLIKALITKASSLLAQVKFVDEVYSAIAKYIYKFQFMFKEDCFSHEEEIRLIKSIPLSDFESKKEKRQYRVQGNLLIPYIVESFENYKDIITEVNVAPCLNDNEIVRSNIIQFLSSNNINSVKDNVLVSNIPVRY